MKEKKQKNRRNMKSITESIKENEEFNPSLSSHKKNYNNLVKWYDNCLRTMDSYEIVDLLKFAISEIEDASFDEIR